MPIQRHRPSRLPFVAGVQVTAIDTGAQISAHTEDLTLFGCYVETITPFALGTKVAIRISHSGTVVVAQGKVAHSEKGSGMGIRFTSIEPNSQSTLDDWVTQLRAT